MGSSHAKAYDAIEGFEICGIVTRSEESRQALNQELKLELNGAIIMDGES